MTHTLIRAMVAAQSDPSDFRHAVSAAIFSQEPALVVAAEDAEIVLAMLAKAAALGNEIPIMRRIISRIIVAHPMSAQEAPGEAGDRVRAEIARVGGKPRGEAPAKRGEVVARPAPKPTAAELAERERERKERGAGAGEGAIESIGASAQPWQRPKAKPCGCDAFPGVACPEHSQSDTELCGCGGFPGDPRPGFVCAKHANYWPR